MSSNKLMEAAADILASSKSKAPGMPPEKLQADVEDLGGPTPDSGKPMDDSMKIHAASKAKDNSAKNRSSISTKSSDASADTQLRMNQEDVGFLTDEEFESLDEEEKLGYIDYLESLKEESKQVSFKEDIDALFANDSTISEEFKSKAATIFEARVLDRVNQIQERLESEYASTLEEAVEDIKNDLTQKVDDYLSYVVEQWVEENEIAIETGLRAELTEEFIAGLRNLFAEHYIDVPTEKVDLVDELAGKVEELESKLNEEIERSVELKKSLIESRKHELIHVVCEGLTATQVEKIKSLAESVDFSTEEEYVEKLETIRENYFPSGVKKASAAQLHEHVEDSGERKSVSMDPFVAAVSQAISKTKLQ